MYELTGLRYDFQGMLDNSSEDEQKNIAEQFKWDIPIGRYLNNNETNKDYQYAINKLNEYM